MKEETKNALEYMKRVRSLRYGSDEWEAYFTKNELAFGTVIRYWDSQRHLDVFDVSIINKDTYVAEGYEGSNSFRNGDFLLFLDD